MSSKLRRFEILLPRRFNDGRDVPDEVLGQALDEILNRFDAVSFEPSVIEGYWSHEGDLYSDSLSKLVVDVEDSDENRLWIKEYKNRWKTNLDQLEIWVVGYEIDLY